jgi:hypothetical protein
MYRQINIFKRIDETNIVIFRCFERLDVNKFCVQSADYFSLPINDSQLKNSEKQLLELFIEEIPDNRSDLHHTIEEAVKHFINDFS